MVNKDCRKLILFCSIDLFTIIQSAIFFSTRIIWSNLEVLISRGEPCQTALAKGYVCLWVGLGQVYAQPGTDQIISGDKKSNPLLTAGKQSSIQLDRVNFGRNRWNSTSDENWPELNEISSRSGRILTDLIKIWPDLTRSASESGGSRSSWLDSVFHVKTHQQTCQIRFLDM